MISADQIRHVFPRCTPGHAAALVLAMVEHHIVDRFEQCHFLAQAGHESGGFTVRSENLNYTIDRLMMVWPKRFPSIASAERYARNPEALANRVYADRMGNGNEMSGDGWRYRGAGDIQLTGYSSHSVCAKCFGIPVEQFGDWLRTDEGAARSAAWFWTVNKIGAVIGQGVAAVTRKVNGGLIGLADREALFERLVEVAA